MSIKVIKTTPYDDQRPGTSGLRKLTKRMKCENYIENFIQSTINALPSEELKDGTFVLSGDGRYYNKEASIIILRILAANGVKKVIIGQNFLMSTPCMSNIIRKYKCSGGIILTASHNPGGPDADFGIKYNCSNGGPAPSLLTEKIFELTKNISSYNIIDIEPQCNDWSQVQTFQFVDMTIDIINACEAYGNLMKDIFNFNKIKEFLNKAEVNIILDAMHGVAGPFFKHVIINLLNGNENNVINGIPSETFNNGHPDPNLTYAHDLVQAMGLNNKGEPLNNNNNNNNNDNNNEYPFFGAACDGDADRNMILGNQFFVTPSDSLAIIAANAQKCIPYFKDGINGVARSMPTSQAVDRVAKQLNISCYEVPTGWKFFGNLMDDKRISLCGEESFGTGSNHIREKDGLWAILAWLSILAEYNYNQNKLIHVKDIVMQHWQTYGRNYYCRYDYEGVEKVAAKKMMNHMIEAIENKSVYDDIKQLNNKYELQSADEFTYIDPVDQSVAKHQGIRFIFKDGSRFVYRLSGTGSVGATIRLYLEKYEDEKDKLTMNTQNALQEMIELALQVSKLKHYTGRDKPTVIT